MSACIKKSEKPFTSLYTSCACNRSPACVDWGYNGLIIYAACHSILVYKPELNGGKVIQSLVSHKKLVTSVHWIHNDKNPETELISTSADSTAIVWSLKDFQFVPTHTLGGHDNVVKTAQAIYLGDSNDELLISTASADSTCKIWRRKDSVIENIQTISFGNGFALAVEFALLSGKTDPLLIIGRDDFKVHLYVWNQSNQFSSCVVLSGHEDWIQGLDLIKEENGTLWLASASQDTFIRVWKISVSEDDVNENELLSGDSLKLKEVTFQSCLGQKYKISLESVLCSHDNFVYSVKWGSSTEKVSFESLRLLSSSMDRTMIIWQPDTNSDLWMDEVRVGEVGGNVLGFYGGVFAPDGKTILAHGFQGAIHIWCYDEDSGLWNPSVPFGGHFSVVQDISWEPDGAFLLSCSYDQTTRLHAPVFKEEKKSWHEIARPQIHGYDIVCLAVVNRFKFVSGSDEKVLRVFKAPKSFTENLEKLCHVDTSSYVKDSLPEGASVPALGLSNKAVYESDLTRVKVTENEQKHPKDMYPEFTFSPVALIDPPTEEVLLQNTLWPEERKLYGHSYEVFSSAANHKGTILASSCKAAKAEHAAIILWDTTTWKKLGNLVFHTLSVTQMEFSPNDEYLLSVSRDRMWVLYRNFPGESPPYRRIANLDKKSGIHTRIIWSCSWSHDNLYFFTASRDKKVAVWEIVNSSSKAESDIVDVPSISQLNVEDSATALSLAPCFSQNLRYIVGIGLDNGKIFIYTWKYEPGSQNLWNLNYCLNEQYAHHLTINRLRFSPIRVRNQDSEVARESLLLASCGSDYQVRINALHFSDLY